MDLMPRGLTAVVTGGSAGIGAAIVRTLAEEGCRVHFCGRSQARIDAALASLPAHVSARLPEVFAQGLARNPLQRLATPEDIARVAAFISSPAASFVAGANWYVDGDRQGMCSFEKLAFHSQQGSTP